MSWKKYFRPVNSVMPRGDSGLGAASNAINKFSSWLPEYYQGPPHRLLRYQQYDQMDMDHEVSAALDTLADFSTKADNNSGMALEIRYNEEATPSEKTILTEALRHWYNHNEFDRRLWRLFRSVLKYGDQFFIRDPQTYKLLWVDPSTVEDKVLVNESTGKTVEAYFIRDLDLNLQSLVASNVNRNMRFGHHTAAGVFVRAPHSSQAGGSGYGTIPGNSMGGGFMDVESMAVDSTHVLHISLSEGMDNSWPFGNSILETIFKVYKQKELLEDSILIYRIHRAPERRIFYIDVGTMPPNKAAQYLERVRYEVQQKRIPSRTGGGDNITDAAYNPMCLDLSTQIPLLDGRVLTLDQIIQERDRGKENWVYSCDPVTGKVVPGNITWAGVTRKHAEVIRIVLDNDQEIVCTPDHKIPVLGKGFVEAQHLTPEDPLISFETRLQSLNGEPCQQVYDHETNTWQYTHQMVAEFFQGLGKRQEWVLDQMPTECDPGNPQWINHQDHPADHSGVMRQTTIGDQQRPENNPEREFTQAMLTRLVELVKENHTNQPETIHLANQDTKMMSLMQEASPIDSNVKHEFTDSKLKRMYAKFGFENWQDFKRKTEVYNHRARSIERLENRDVGTITVDFEEKWHAHHTFALQAGIFVKNSMLEDYFFAQTCLALDTGIPLWDGRTLTLAQLIAEHEQGRENWVYSQNRHTNELEAGRVAWAGVTRRDTPVYRVTLDNGQWIDATGDHRFIMRDGSEKPAEQLEPCDSLMPLHFRPGKISFKQKGSPNQRYVCNATGKVRWTHTAICPNTDTPAQCSDEMFARVVELYNEGHDSAAKICRVLRDDGEFQARFRRATPAERGDRGHNRFELTGKTLNQLVSTAGYSSWDEFKQNYCHNHKVVSVELLPTRTDTGDITVESPSDSHIFLTAAGVFVHNSDGRGSKVETLPGGENLGCLSMDTRVSLLDGREMSIAEISLEMQQGVKLWTYSTHPITGEIAPGLISWAGETRKNAQVMRITLDSGESIVCTPDHEFPILNRGFVPAEHLEKGQSLIPVCRKNKNTSPGHSGVEQVFDPSKNKWVLTHRMVSDFLQGAGASSEVEHLYAGHIDHDPLSGSPQTTEPCGASPNSSGRRVKWLMENDAAFVEAVSNNIRGQDPSGWQERSREIIKANLKRWKVDGYYDQVFESQGIKYDLVLLSRAAELLAGTKATTMAEFAEQLDHDLEFGTHWRFLNHEIDSGVMLQMDRCKLGRMLRACGTNWNKFKLSQKNINPDDELLLILNRYEGQSQEQLASDLEHPQFQTRHKLMKKIRQCGFDDFSMFSEYATGHNHRIVRVEYLEELKDVGTLSIDIDEKYHDFHTFALSAGVFTKNSIDDLRYFNNKMLRGLGVPSGYLPTGPEDGSNSYNDGRVGAAFIQEFRFSGVCQRYQKMIAPALDREFKLFLRKRNVNIDAGLFDLKFGEPQSFSEYRQLELDNARAALFGNVSGIPHLSRRFAMKRYLGLTEDEMNENETLWREENNIKHLTQDEGAEPDLRSADVRPLGGGMDFGGGDFGGDFGDDEFMGDQAGGDLGGDLDGGDEPQL